VRCDTASGMNTRTGHLKGLKGSFCIQWLCWRSGLFQGWHGCKYSAFQSWNSASYLRRISSITTRHLYQASFPNIGLHISAEWCFPVACMWTASCSGGALVADRNYPEHCCVIPKLTYSNRKVPLPLSLYIQSTGNTLVPPVQTSSVLI
jgi:hypothetical protein